MYDTIITNKAIEGCSEKVDGEIYMQVPQGLPGLAPIPNIVATGQRFRLISDFIDSLLSLALNA
jgi:hypothetical protein